MRADGHSGTFCRGSRVTQPRRCGHAVPAASAAQLGPASDRRGVAPTAAVCLSALVRQPVRLIIHRML